ncbi:amino acid ABC transporter permease [Caldisericum sp.]|uniref:amino acid ABC transporter permease n=1 Tax=Caldisericum sp. TaxID=2499687 RepID=UPI003D0A046A
MIFDVSALNLSNLIYVLRGIFWTLFLTFVSIGLGLILGSALAFGEVYLPPPFSYIFRIIGEVLRGVPLILLFLILYFAFNLGMTLSAILGLGLRSASYQGQIFRSSLEAISAGQLHAGLSLGMTKFQVFKEILVPQALRIMIPGWTNEFITVLKDTSIAFVLGVMDIMTRADFIARSIGRYFEIYIFIALVYFVLVKTSMSVLNNLYERVRIPGLGEKR